MKKWIFRISILINIIVAILFIVYRQNISLDKLNHLEKDTQISLLGSDSTAFNVSTREKNTNNLPQGTFIYELYFAEHPNMQSRECEVIILRNQITINQTEKTNLSGEKRMFKGMVLQHKSSAWILTNNEEDINADEIGGCTDIPIIDFNKMLIEWC